jgi:hypothetical protein
MGVRALSAFLVQVRGVVGSIQVTAWTGEGVTRLALDAVAVEGVHPEDCEPPLSSDLLLDEHLLVCEDGDGGRASIADVIVRDVRGPHAASHRWNGALVTCVTDLQARRCAICVGGEDSAWCFTEASGDHTAVEIAETFAWTASFFHCQAACGLAGAKPTRLEVHGSYGGCVTLVPCALDHG